MHCPHSWHAIKHNLNFFQTWSIHKRVFWRGNVIWRQVARLFPPALEHTHKHTAEDWVVSDKYQILRHLRGFQYSLGAVVHSPIGYFLYYYSVNHDVRYWAFLYTSYENTNWKQKLMIINVYYNAQNYFFCFVDWFTRHLT